MTQLVHDRVRGVVDALQAEDRRVYLKERRSVDRQSMFRPVNVYLGRQGGEPKTAFTRDLSHLGIGLVHDFDVRPGQVATLSIHRLWDDPVALRCEARWCETWGKGWYTSGWNILAVETS